MTISVKLDKLTYVAGDKPKVTVSGVVAEGGTGSVSAGSGVLTGTLSNGQKLTLTVSTPGMVGTAAVVPQTFVTDNQGGVWSGGTRSALDASDVGELAVTVRAGTQWGAGSATVIAGTTPAPVPVPVPAPAPSPGVYPAVGTWVKPGNVGNLFGTSQTRSSLGSPNGADGWYEGILFTGKVSTTNGKFRKCTFEQSGSSSTEGGSAYAVATGAVQFEDCTFRISGGLNATGGPAAGRGLDKGIQATRGGLSVVRCDVSGANIPATPLITSGVRSFSTIDV